MNSRQNLPQAVVVTGAAGFIGSTLIAKLLSTTDLHVIGIDNFHSFYNRNLKEQNLEAFKSNKKFSFYESCFSNVDLWLKLNRNFKIRTVIHFAAFAGVRPSLEDPQGYYMNNVVKTLALLDLMRDLYIEELIFTSSSSVYGGNKIMPFNEEHKVDSPVSPYAATKKAGEEIIYTYCHLYGMKAVALRLFTVFGPKQRPDLAIRKFMVNIMDDQPITLFGNGSSRRDYTFVSDIVDGYLASLYLLPTFAPGKLEVMNRGGGRAISLLQMDNTVEHVLGKKATVQFEERHPADVEVTLADISKAEKILHYNPKVGFGEGVEELYGWLINNQLAMENFRSMEASKQTASPLRLLTQITRNWNV
ncbi:MAG: GDP-mannose 4,6-dehydratase [Pseudobdellovibrionaceae bacterium]